MISLTAVLFSPVRACLHIALSRVAFALLGRGPPSSLQHKLQAFGFTARASVSIRLPLGLGRALALRGVVDGLWSFSSELVSSRGIELFI